MWWRNRRPAFTPVTRDIGPDQEQQRGVDLTDRRINTAELDPRLPDASREPTQLLPLMDSMLMTRAAQWRAAGGQS